MESEKHNPFDLNRTEYAELLGVSPNCIRMRLRQKKLEGQYIFENGKYLFLFSSKLNKLDQDVGATNASAGSNNMYSDEHLFIPIFNALETFNNLPLSSYT